MNLIFTILRKRISGLELLRRKIAHHYLQEVAERHIKEREQRLSVFANDLIGISIFLDGIYEREHIQTLLTLVQHLDPNAGRAAAVDLGANIGNHSLVFSRHFSEVHAFEPHTQTFDLLSMNISRVGNIKAYNIGVGEKAEQMLLHENISNMGGSSVVNDSGQKSIQVNVLPLDDALDSPIPISLIKIDIEGMEYSALKGAVETIKAHQPIIAFEQHASLFEYGTTASIRLLVNLGYTFCWIETNPNYSSKNFFIRTISQFKELLVGRTLTYSICFGEKIPPKSHTMLIAVPRRLLKNIDILSTASAHNQEMTLKCP